MADLIEELGITPQVLYGHFATKRDLFVACYKVAVQYMDAFLQPRFEKARDSAEMQVWYMYADSGIKAFAPNMMMLAIEAAQHDEEARRDLREAYRDHLRRRRRRSQQHAARREDDPPFSDELIIHAIIGRLRADARPRRAWTTSTPGATVVRNGLGLFLAVRAVYRGDLDLSELPDQVRRRCSTRSRELPPPVPDELEP